MTSTLARRNVPVDISGRRQPAVRLRQLRIGLLPIGVGKVAFWQVMVLIAAFSIGANTIVAIAALGIAMTSIRFDGMCGYHIATIYARYLIRRGKATGMAPTAVLAAQPRLRAHTHIDRAGNRLGVTTLDGEGSYGVTIRISQATQPDPAALISLLRELFDKADVPVSTAQLVVHATPASVRTHWLAVRYRCDDAPWATVARGGGEPGGHKAIASVALRLVSWLADAGHPSSVCDTPDLYGELHTALGAGPDTVPGKGYRATETWRSWSIGRLRQICFVPHRPSDAITLMGRCAAGAAFTCTAYTLRRDARGRVRGTAAVRLGVAPGRLRVAGLGVPLTPTSGRHARYVVATLPLALP